MSFKPQYGFWFDEEETGLILMYYSSQTKCNYVTGDTEDRCNQKAKYNSINSDDSEWKFCEFHAKEILIRSIKVWAIKLNNHYFKVLSCSNENELIRIVYKINNLTPIALLP